MYISSQNLLIGLSDLHNSIRAITQVRQLRQLITAKQEFLNKSTKTKLTTDEMVILKSTDVQLENFFTINLDLTRNNSTVNKLVAGAQVTLLPLNEMAVQLAKGEMQDKINPLVVDQYVLEAQDQLGKVQLVLADESDEIFNRVYDSRFIPLTVGLFLSGCFLLFALLMGLNLKNKIDRPIQKLIEAALALSNGQLNVRAPVGEANEVGLLTHTFNVMAEKLEDGMNERKRAAEDLFEAKEAAESANRAKSAFLANMSHEIRTPLGAVMGFADLVVDQNVNPTEKINFVAAIKRNGELLSNIINDILDLSKIEAGKMQIETHEVSLAEILSDTKTLLELQAKNKGIDLRVNIDQNVPQTIKTDPLRLRQVLINIIGNAIKFTNRGHISLIVKYETEQVVFIVEDTGCGIDEEQVAKLFSAFTQADATTKRKFGGTGLGLILSKRFANLLGGDVVLMKSSPGKGSTFKITIHPGESAAAVAPNDARTVSTPVPRKDRPLHGLSVLLAEDSPDNQILLSHLLDIAGAQVDLAANGKIATEKALAKSYDVILMDIQMPVMDGFEATALLRKNGYRGKIMALTAHALNEDRELTLRSGFDDHISKPVNRDILIDRVCNSLRPV